MINMCRRQDLASVAGFSSNKVCVLIAMRTGGRDQEIWLIPLYSFASLAQ